MSTLFGVFLCVDQAYRECLVIFIGLTTKANFAILDMEEFDVIMRMGCVFPFHVAINYFTKILIMEMPERGKFK